MKSYNFNSGPSVLPKEVLEEAANAVLDFNNTGLSILELGHRTKHFENVVDEAVALVKKFMGISDDYDVVFLQGGATTQFMQVPMNFLASDETAAYINNGIWGKKAIAEAKFFGNVAEVSNTSDKNHRYLDKSYVVPKDAKFLHVTINNTVEGTEWLQTPDSQGIPLVGDMSSDIFSRPADFDKYDLIYAGAQKNIGCAGATLVVLKKEFTDKISKNINPIMDYRQHIKANSLFNTPPVMAIYTSLLTLRWIDKEGGLVEMEKRAIEKSNLLYNFIDNSDLYLPKVVKEDRSRMNVTFDIADEQIKVAFLQECDQHNFIGIKGHRSVGGLRVSLYNALPLEDLKVLLSFMEDFAQRKG